MALKVLIFSLRRVEGSLGVNDLPLCYTEWSVLRKIAVYLDAQSLGLQC